MRDSASRVSGRSGWPGRGALRIDHGHWRAWLVLAACFAAVLLASGARTSFAAFVRPIEADTGWDRAVLSAAASLNVLSYGLGQLGIGFLVDRWGPRRVMILSLVLMAAGGFGMAGASTLWHLYLFYGILPGLGFAGAGLVPASAMLLGWFPGKPAFALGIASAALPAGLALFVPLAAAAIPYFGWRGTYIGLGLLMAVVAVPVLWWLTRDPPRPAPGSAEQPSRLSLQSIGLVGLISAGFLACGLTDQLVAVHLVPFASGLGLSSLAAASAQSLLTLVGIAGSVAAGRAADLWSPRWVLVLTYLLRAVTFPLLLVFAASLDLVTLYLFALLFGPTYIANTAPAGRLLRQRYGQHAVGALMGITQFIHQLGAAVGVGLGGLSYALAGSYGPAWVVASAVALAGAAVSLALPESGLPGGRPADDTPGTTTSPRS